MAIGIGSMDWSQRLIEPNDPQLDLIRDRRAAEAAAARQQAAERAKIEAERRGFVRTLPRRIAEAQRLGATPQEMETVRRGSLGGVPSIEERVKEMEAMENWQPPGYQSLAVPGQAGPMPPPPPALDLDARVKQLEEQERAAASAPKPSGLEYSIGGGPMKSYNPGGGPDPEFKRYHDDMVFGQKRTPPPAAGRQGTVSMMTALNDPMEDPNYRNYLANGGRLEEETAKRANIARNEMLAKDPMAVERFSIEQAIQQQDAQMKRTTARDDARRDYIHQLVSSDVQRQLAALRQHPNYQNASPIDRAAAERNIIDEANERLLQAETNPRAFGEGLGG